MKRAPLRAAPGRYSPPECIGCKSHVISGESGPGAHRHVLCRTPEFDDANVNAPIYSADKCVLEENHCHALALYFMWYNWIRKHKAHGTTPAIAAGITAKALTMADMAVLVDDLTRSLIQ